MNNQEHQAGALAMMIAVGAIAHARGIADEDLPAVASVAFGEVLGRYLGPVGAVDHLRNVADLLERQIMTDLN